MRLLLLLLLLLLLMMMVQMQGLVRLFKHSKTFIHHLYIPVQRPNCQPRQQKLSNKHLPCALV